MIALARSGKIGAHVERFSLDEAAGAYEQMRAGTLPRPRSDRAVAATMTTDIRRIVVDIDGSDNARRAAEWAAALARALDAEVVAVSALGLLARTEGGAPVPAQAHRDEIRTTFERSWGAPLAAADVTYRLELRDGSPVPVLLGVADEVDADVIVVESRGVGGFPDLLLGSTTTQVTQHSRRPVAIVPAAATPGTLDPGTGS